MVVQGIINEAWNWIESPWHHHSQGVCCDAAAPASVRLFSGQSLLSFSYSMFLFSFVWGNLALCVCPSRWLCSQLTWACLKSSFCINTYLYTLVINSGNNRVHWRDLFKLVRNDIVQRFSQNPLKKSLSWFPWKWTPWFWVLRRSCWGFVLFRFLISMKL